MSLCIALNEVEVGQASCPDHYTAVHTKESAARAAGCTLPITDHPKLPTSPLPPQTLCMTEYNERSVKRRDGERNRYMAFSVCGRQYRKRRLRELL